jgi:hypothetical protein
MISHLVKTMFAVRHIIGYTAQWSGIVPAFSCAIPEVPARGFLDKPELAVLLNFLGVKVGFPQF